MVFYDMSGDPMLYTDDSEHLYLFDGSAVGYFHKTSVYSYTGLHLGFFHKGWILDNDGMCAFFTTYANGGPQQPKKNNLPKKHDKEFTPRKQFREYRPDRPKMIDKWSDLSGISFFARIFDTM